PPHRGAPAVAPTRGWWQALACGRAVRSSCPFPFRGCVLPNPQDGSTESRSPAWADRNPRALQGQSTKAGSEGGSCGEWSSWIGNTFKPAICNFVSRGEYWISHDEMALSASGDRAPPV